MKKCHLATTLVNRSCYHLGGMSLCVLLAVALGLGRAEVILWDDFSDEEITTPTESASGAVWVVASGKFAADGSDIGNYKPVAGELNFGVEEDTEIRIDYGPIVEESATTLKLDIRQSNESNGHHRFDIILAEEKDDGALVLGCSPHSEFFATSGFALFDSQENLLALGLGGSALRGDIDWQNIEFQIDPNNGVSVLQDGMLILQWKNEKSTPFTPTRLSLKSTVPGMSWFVKNVEVDSTIDQEVLKKISSETYERNIR